MRKDGHTAFDELFNLPEESDFVFGAEGEGAAAFTGTGGATDAVHVGVGLHGEVEINHQSNVFHIDATGGHIGGHQDTNVAALVLVECLLAGVL